MLFQRYLSMRNPTIPDAHQTVTNNTDHPSEAKVTPKQADTYVVPADQPRSITLPSIHADGLIQRVGLTSDNALAVPSSIYFGGWYTGGSKPGDKGLSIIDGHVSGWYNDGIFKNLKNLHNGDMFTVEYGDRSTRKFAVVDVKTIPEDKASMVLFQQRSDLPNQLNLITCGGKFDTKTDLYADRIIVISKFVS